MNLQAHYRLLCFEKLGKFIVFFINLWTKLLFWLLDFETDVTEGSAEFHRYDRNLKPNFHRWLLNMPRIQKDNCKSKLQY